jgi:cytoskeletal protein RodZ
LEEIGNLFLLTREAAGISLKEVSEDLEIEQAILENIEDGKTGAFSDIFVLKEYVASYAKYLGLDADKIIDEFNEFIFEATSKIPIKEIEKQIAENNKNEEENKVVSPYTKKEKKVKNGVYLFVYILLVLSLIVAVFWSVKQITINNNNATIISYGK